MRNDTAPEPGAGFRIYILLSVVAFVLGLLYVGWVFYSRWEANREIQEKAAEKRRAKDAEAFDAMGGNRFEIMSFNADPATMRAGETTSLCYSVSNAKSVKIDPPSEEPVWPAFARCVHVSPRKTTKYTLSIEDGAGHSKSAEIEVEVQPVQSADLGARKD